MQAEGDIHRHLQAAALGQHVAAASQVVHPLAAAAVVVGIVVDAVRGGIDAVRETCPLQVVARTQVEPGMLTAADVAVVHAFLAQEFLVFLLGGEATVLLGGQCHATHDVALAAAHLDGVGGDDGILIVAQVRHLDDSLVHALGQREGAQIDPHAASHRLIDTELARSTQAVDGIGHVTGAVGQRFIGNIDGKLASLGHIDVPRGGREFLLVFLGHDHAVRALGKRILKVLVSRTQEGETAVGTGEPLLLAVALAVALLRLTAVVIDHDAKVVRVALAGVPHIGSRILQHRDEEGQHIAVGVHVLHRLHQAGTLPLPAVELGLEVPAVAGPHRHDVTVQTMLVMAVGVELADEGGMLALVGGLIVGKVLVDVVAHDGDEHRAMAIVAAQRFTDLVTHLLDALLGERHVAEVLTHVNLNGVVLNGDRTHLQVSHAHQLGQLAGNDALHGILLLLGERLFLGLQRQHSRHTCDHTQQYFTSLFHNLYFMLSFSVSNSQSNADATDN